MNFSEAGLLGLKNTLLGYQGVVQAQLNERQIARNTMNLVREALLEALRKFNGIVDAFYVGTVFEGTRPKVPGVGVRLQDFADPMLDAQTLWARLNVAEAPAGLALPLSLPVVVPEVLGMGVASVVNLATFTELVETLNLAHANIATVNTDLTLARNQRDDTQRSIYAALKAYRLTAPSRLASSSLLLFDMPELTATSSRTPEPVNASAVFVAPDSSKVVFEESPDVDLDHYALHGVAGDEWDADDAVTVAMLPKGADPREFVTAFGLTQPGSAATFKVYVVLTTGNQRGSTAMTVLRPVV